MSGGQQGDPGKLSGAGGAYTAKGEELGNAAGKVKPGVGEGQIGNLWKAMASKYGDAIDKYSEAMKTYGEQASDLGKKFSNAVGSSESGEAVSTETIANQC